MSKAADYVNHYKLWTDRHQEILMRIVLRNARNNVPMEQTWIETSERFKRKPKSCEVAWNRFAPQSKKRLAAYHYEAWANGTYSSNPEASVEEASETPVEALIHAPKEILESIEEVSASLVLPMVSEANVEITPLVKALAFIVAQVGALESRENKYRGLARTRKEEIAQLNIENDGLRTELKKARNRLAQVVKE